MSLRTSSEDWGRIILLLIYHEIKWLSMDFFSPHQKIRAYLIQGKAESRFDHVENKALYSLAAWDDGKSSDVCFEEQIDINFVG